LRAPGLRHALEPPGRLPRPPAFAGFRRPRLLSPPVSALPDPGVPRPDPVCLALPARAAPLRYVPAAARPVASSRVGARGRSPAPPLPPWRPAPVRVPGARVGPRLAVVVAARERSPVRGRWCWGCGGWPGFGPVPRRPPPRGPVRAGGRVVHAGGLDASSRCPVPAPGHAPLAGSPRGVRAGVVVRTPAPAAPLRSWARVCARV